MEGKKISEGSLSQPEDVLHREVPAERDQPPANKLLVALLASQSAPGHPFPKLFSGESDAFETCQVLHMERQRSFSQRMLHLRPARNQGPQHRNEARPARTILCEKPYFGAQKVLANQKRANHWCSANMSVNGDRKENG